MNSKIHVIDNLLVNSMNNQIIQFFDMMGNAWSIYRFTLELWNNLLLS